MSFTRIFFLIPVLLMVASPAAAQGQGGGGVSVASGASGVSDGFLAGAHVFFFNDEASLGSDELSQGAAVYTRFDMQYNMENYFFGLGLFYEKDSFGEVQADTITGLVVEFVLGNFFVKVMPGFVDQEFEGRSFSKRSGDFFGTEFGIRANLFAGILFYEVKLHQRSVEISQEDSRTMEDKFATSQTFPMLGMGVSL